MWVVNARAAVLSIITGSGKWVEIKVYADPPHQNLLSIAEKKFWRCVQSGEHPHLFGTEAPGLRLEAVRVVERSASNSSAELAAAYSRSRSAYQDRETAKTEPKKLCPRTPRRQSGTATYHQVREVFWHLRL